MSGPKFDIGLIHIRKQLTFLKYCSVIQQKQTTLNDGKVRIAPISQYSTNKTKNLSPQKSIFSPMGMKFSLMRIKSSFKRIKLSTRE